MEWIRAISRQPGVFQPELPRLEAAFPQEIKSTFTRCFLPSSLFSAQMTAIEDPT
jgi:hypothetical protein